MARPAKTVAIISSEKRGHRTKTELEARKTAEKSVMTGEKMRESAAVKADERAHKHWGRVRRLMAVIGRDDAMHERVINRYCMMLSECERLAEDVREAEAMIDRLQAMRNGGGAGEEAWTPEPGELTEMAKAMDALLTVRLKAEAELDKKRGMLLAIEKENLMTVAAGLRAVPKKPPEEEPDPMEALFAVRSAG